MAAQPFTIEIDKQQLADARAMLDGFVGTAISNKGSEAAIQRSLSRTIDHAQSSVVKRVAQEVNLLQKNIRPYTRKVKPNYTTLSGKVIISANAIPLVDFPHITSLIGTSVSVRKARPAELFRHRFKATMRSGHVGIFERRLKGGTPVARLPVDETYGPSPGRVFYENGNPDMEEIADFFARQLDHEVEYILSQAK